MWPNGTVKTSGDGPGFIHVYTPGNPALGADIVFAGSVVGRARVQTFMAKLVTSAAAGNRFPQFIFAESSSGATLYQVQDPQAVPASTTITYSLAPGGTNVRGGGAPIFETLPVPAPLYCKGAANISTLTQGIQAGDQWSAIAVSLEEWMEQF